MFVLSFDFQLQVEHEKHVINKYFCLRNMTPVYVSLNYSISHMYKRSSVVTRPSVFFFVQELFYL
jgi:hypothetical protein